MSISNTNKKQRGGALLIAMVMIFMITLMGVSAMRGSSLERRMATNSVQSGATFQTAESLTDKALNESSNLESAWRQQGMPYKVPAIDLKNNFTAVQAVEAEYNGTSIAPGFSTAVGGSSFDAFQYEVRGATEISDTRTRSAVVQGAYRIVPGS